MSISAGASADGAAVSGNSGSGNNPDQTAALRKLSEGGFNVVDLPQARDEPLWGEIRTEYNLSLVELSALKDFACSAMKPPREVLQHPSDPMLLRLRSSFSSFVRWARESAIAAAPSFSISVPFRFKSTSVGGDGLLYRFNDERIRSKFTIRIQSVNLSHTIWMQNCWWTLVRIRHSGSPPAKCCSSGLSLAANHVVHVARQTTVASL